MAALTVASISLAISFYKPSTPPYAKAILPAVASLVLALPCFLFFQDRLSYQLAPCTQAPFCICFPNVCLLICLQYSASLPPVPRLFRFL